MKKLKIRVKWERGVTIYAYVFIFMYNKFGILVPSILMIERSIKIQKLGLIVCQAWAHVKKIVLYYIIYCAWESEIKY